MPSKTSDSVSHQAYQLPQGIIPPSTVSQIYVIISLER